jgi:hypothetical protein
MRYILNVSKETKIVDSTGANSYRITTRLNPRVLANEETRENRDARLEDSDFCCLERLTGYGFTSNRMLRIGLSFE